MSERWIANWGQEFALAGCESCDWLYLLPPAKLPLICPHCGRTELAMMDETADTPIYTHPPELILPFIIHQQAIEGQMKQFAAKIWLAPPDLRVDNLVGRLQPIYMPMWLVDAAVQAQWQAEIGFDYQVVSHRERHSNGSWQSQQVQRTRVRWEPRLGILNRHYDNTSAPALEDHDEMVARLGQYDRRKAQPYQPMNEALLRLPNRPPQDAWSDVTAVLHTIAADDCRRAAKGDHLREFKWTATFSNQHWTQLLLPLYTTYYLDDSNQPQVLLINGQTGLLNGRKQASMNRAFRLAGVIAALAILLFLVGLVFMFAVEGGSAGETAVTFSFFALLASLLPILYVWQFNRAH